MGSPGGGGVGASSAAATRATCSTCGRRRTALDRHAAPLRLTCPRSAGCLRRPGARPVTQLRSKGFSPRRDGWVSPGHRVSDGLLGDLRSLGKGARSAVLGGASPLQGDGAVEGIRRLATKGLGGVRRQGHGGARRNRRAIAPHTIKPRTARLGSAHMERPPVPARSARRDPHAGAAYAMCAGPEA